MDKGDNYLKNINYRTLAFAYDLLIKLAPNVELLVK